MLPLLSACENDALRESVFHAARALLFSVGLEATTHKGLVALLGQHFVRPGLLSADMGRLSSPSERLTGTPMYMGSCGL